MHSELESQVWLTVQQVCDAATFEALILRAVDSFKRSPGYDPVLRLYASDIGQSGVQILRDVLHRCGIRFEHSADLPGYLELRSRLKHHIRCQLQQYLVSAGHSTEEMRQDQLARDLGL